MRNVMIESTADAIRMRLQILYTHHSAAVRHGDERLQAAMAEYGQSLSQAQDRGGRMAADRRSMGYGFTEFTVKTSLSTDASTVTVLPA